MTFRHTSLTDAEMTRARAAMSIPLRTLEQVKTAIDTAKKTNSDKTLARLMLRHGRMTDEAILWIGDNYAHVWEA